MTKEYKRTKRARTKLGRYRADDKSTADHNEAWVGGRKPRKKRKVYTIRGKKYVLKKGRYGAIYHIAKGIQADAIPAVSGGCLSITKDPV